MVSFYPNITTYFKTTFIPKKKKKLFVDYKLIKLRKHTLGAANLPFVRKITPVHAASKTAHQQEVHWQHHFVASSKVRWKESNQFLSMNVRTCSPLELKSVVPYLVWKSFASTFIQPPREIGMSSLNRNFGTNVGSLSSISSKVNNFYLFVYFASIYLPFFFGSDIYLPLNNCTWLKLGWALHLGDLYFYFCLVFHTYLQISTNGDRTVRWMLIGEPLIHGLGWT